MEATERILQVGERAIMHRDGECPYHDCPQCGNIAKTTPVSGVEVVIKDFKPLIQSLCTRCGFTKNVPYHPYIVGYSGDGVTMIASFDELTPIEAEGR